MFNRNTKSGFTLVEVLVVLAIIGVLAALLFPTFLRVRENGRRANCQSNLRQIGLAIRQYVQDNDGIYPDGFHTGASWVEIIQPYAKNSQIFVCPSQIQISTFNYDYNIWRSTRFSPRPTKRYRPKENRKAFSKRRRTSLFLKIPPRRGRAAMSGCRHLVRSCRPTAPL